MVDSKRKRLERLLRSVAREKLTGGTDFLHAYGHTGVNRAEKPAVEPVPVEQACPGVESACQEQGRFWLIRRPLKLFSPDDAAIARQYAEVLRGARQRIDELAASAGLCHAADAEPEQLLFMDIETCGLAGNPIFLVGAMFYEGGDLVFEQYLARNYSEEAAILHAYARRYEQAGLLVTFNGKSFDLGAIRDRSAFHRVELPWAEPPHLDLLHEARRLWRKQLPNCRLQTLERFLCGRHRVGDIPSAAIPDAYHRFVETGDARRLKDILHHNLLDLLTMAQVLALALTGTDPTLR